MLVKKLRKLGSRSRLKKFLAAGIIATGIGIAAFNGWHENYKQHDNVTPMHEKFIFNPDSLTGMSVPRSRKIIASSHVYHIPTFYNDGAICEKAAKLKGLKRADFFKKIFRQEPRKTYLAVEKYMVDYAKKYDLSPDLVLFIFYHRQFDLRNPLGVEYEGIIQKYAGKYMTKKDFEKDPFLGIEIGVKYLTALAKKYHKRGIIPILTEYLYGPFFSRDKSHKMMAIVRRRLAAYRRHYKSFFGSVLIRAPGRSFYSHLDLNVRDYRYLTDSEFKKLSEKGKRLELYKYMKYISKQLGIDPKILFRMASVESTFNPHAYNKFTHATGLLQIEPILYRDLIKNVDFKSMFGKTPRFRDLDDAYTNILFGAIYLNYCLINLRWNYERALSAYNIGFDKYLRIIHKLGGKKLDAANRYLNKLRAVNLNQLLTYNDNE